MQSRVSSCFSKNLPRLAQYYSRSFSSSVFRFSLNDDFKLAKDNSKKLTNDPGNQVKLKMYALFKQSTEGVCNAPKPGMMDLVGKAKWSAWKELGELSQDDAKKEYIKIVEDLRKEDGAEEVAQVSGEFETIKYELSNGVALVTLNRPKKFNAFSLKMYDELNTAFKQADESKDVSIIALTGAGNYYCSGNDLTNFQAMPGDTIEEKAKTGKQVLIDFTDSFIDLKKPIVGLINGPAIGLSVTVLGLFDAIFAAENATFQTPFVATGQTPEGCSTYTFPRIMGLINAKEMLLLGKKITAKEAKLRGLVSNVYPSHSFRDEALKDVQELSAAFKLFPQTVLDNKLMVKSQADKDVLKQINREEADRLAARWLTAEFMDFVTRFMSRSK